MNVTIISASWNWDALGEPARLVVHTGSKKRWKSAVVEFWYSTNPPFYGTCT